MIQEFQIANNGIKSFGFRKGFKTADAIVTLKSYAWKGKQARVIEADIEQCFDKINHDKILEILNSYNCIEGITAMVKGCLKAQILYGEVYTDPTEGTPQGGNLSPTIANIVLRETLDKKFEVGLRKIKAKRGCQLITYADDLIIMQQGIGKPENLPKILEMTSNMIKDIGLNLKTEKTRIIEDDAPFEFLSYEIQRGKGIRLNPKIIKRTRQKCKKSISYGRRQNRVLKEINPVLRGVYNYAGYFSNGKMWNQLGKMRLKIAKRFHKVYKEYGENKIVSYKEVNKIVNYIPPQEPTILQNPQYWNARNLKGLQPRKKLLWKRQKGICEHCRGRLGYDSSMLQTHHLKEKSKGGRDKNSNVVLIHKECHEAFHNL